MNLIISNIHSWVNSIFVQHMGLSKRLLIWELMNFVILSMVGDVPGIFFYGYWCNERTNSNDLEFLGTWFILSTLMSFAGFAEPRRMPWCLIGAGIHVKPSSLGQESGWGLFADRSFEVGEVITFYDGCLVVGAEVVRSKENSARNSALNWVAAIAGSGYSIYGLTIPLAGRGGGSFANHSTKRVNACLRHHPSGLKHANYYYVSQLSAMFRNRKLPGITVVAKANIFAGDEIFIDYGQGTCKRMGIIYPDQ